MFDTFVHKWEYYRILIVSQLSYRNYRPYRQVGTKLQARVRILIMFLWPNSSLNPALIISRAVLWIQKKGGRRCFLMSSNVWIFSLACLSPPSVQQFLLNLEGKT